jgi:thiol-disulfide isomerase/thioredoxin
MKYLVLLLLCGLFLSTGTSAQELKINLKNHHRIGRYGGSTQPVYKLTFDTLMIQYDTVAAHNKLAPIVLPELKNAKDTGFVKLFFTGNKKGYFRRQVYTLVVNYKSDSTFLWVDYNGNLNFADDSTYKLICKSKPVAYVSLYNAENPKGKFLYKINKVHYKDTALRNRVKEYFYNDNEKKGFVTTGCDYWLESTRLNILSCDTAIEGHKLQLGVMDWTCNGIYNNKDSTTEDNYNADRVLIGKYGDSVLSSMKSAGAVAYNNNVMIGINGRMWLVKDIEPTGEYMIIKKTDKTYDLLKPGDKLPDFKYKLFDGTETSLHKQLAKGKYNLLDFWGFWCKGCILAFPKMKKFDSLYSDKFHIIGLHDNMSNPSYAIKTKKKYNLPWNSGFATTEIQKALFATDVWPYYVLIDGDGRIVKFDIHLNEIEEILKKE